MAKDKGPKRPTRDEYVLEELGERLVEAHQEKENVELEIWNQGSVVGRIVKLDSRTKLIHVEKENGETERVPFMDIMKVGNAG
ncbi:YolD-like family protein [Paenibacillus agaridevorans]|uniref:YolD-like family protein n=1 Tax=Paenibacillus agaridevorans TaxID=171404 RepID=UPI001BE48155|nr:YolD-like family protein [Paenibacillus agaridevorans]